MMFKSVIVLLISFVSIGHALKCLECFGGKKCVDPEPNFKPLDCNTVEYDDFGFPNNFKLRWDLLPPEEKSKRKLKESVNYEYNCLYAALSNNVAMRSCWRGEQQDFQTIKDEIIKASEYNMITELCATDGCNQKTYEASKCGGTGDSNNAATSIITLGAMSLLMPLINFLVL